MKPGSAIARTRSSRGSSATSRYTGLVMSGCSVHSRPMRMPTGRAATWARMVTPSAFAASSSSRIRRHESGASGDWASDRDRGRPDSAAMRRKMPISSSTSMKSDTSWSTPFPASPRARAMPTSSSASAVSVGVGSPRLVRWFSVREVVKPRAPSSTACRAMRAISAMSSGVAGSRREPRSPMTCRRRAPWGSWVARSMSCGRRSRKSRNSPKVCQSHDSPSWSAVPGMSSTPSISSMRRWWSAGRTGAKPTPQLPMTTVVTPCHDEGAREESHVACPS